MQVKIVISGCDGPNRNATLAIMLYWDKIIPHIPRDHSTERQVEGLIRTPACQHNFINIRIFVFVGVLCSKITSRLLYSVTGDILRLPFPLGPSSRH